MFDGIQVFEGTNKTVAREMVTQMVTKGNPVGFPEDSKDVIAVLNREKPTEKFIHIYDVRRQSFVRKLGKDFMEDESFALDG